MCRRHRIGILHRQGSAVRSLRIARGTTALALLILTLGLARTAGEALAAVTGATVVDAIVMASAALRGDVVYTSDVEDLERLRSYFRGVRVLSA